MLCRVTYSYAECRYSECRTAGALYWFKVVVDQSLPFYLEHEEK